MSPQKTDYKRKYPLVWEHLYYINSESPLLRYLAYATLSVHRINPGELINAGLKDTDLKVSARAIRLAAELGLHNKLPFIADHMNSNNDDCRFWAAWSAALLGEHRQSLPILDACSQADNWYGEQAAQLMVRVLDSAQASAWLKQNISRHGISRAYIKAMAALGSPQWVSELIGYMEQPELARLAAYALTVITGADLDFLDFDADPPANDDTQPNDDPDDSQVDWEEDDDLIWPEVEAIAAWWDQQSDYQNGQVYLNGQSKTETHLLNSLQQGRQTHRMAAATELALLRPEQPLFAVQAPAFRQRKAIHGG